MNNEFNDAEKGEVQESKENTETKDIKSDVELDESEFDVEDGEQENTVETLDEDSFQLEDEQTEAEDQQDTYEDDVDKIDEKSWSDILVPNFVYKAKIEIERNHSMKLTQLETKVNGEYTGTPKIDSPAGHWTGVRGDSVFVTNPDYVPQNSKMNPEHKSYGDLGISEVRYKKGDIQLKEFAVDTEKIEMTNDRTDNFRMADTKFAEKNGMTISEAKQYRIDNHLTWHERQDMKTIDLVPSVVNGTLRHSGGVSFINRDIEREAKS